MGRRFEPVWAHFSKASNYSPANARGFFMRADFWWRVPAPKITVIEWCKWSSMVIFPCNLRGWLTLPRAHPHGSKRKSLEICPFCPFSATNDRSIRQGSVGSDILFRNLGSYSFSVVDFSGALSVTVSPGQSKYFYLSSNATVAGTWQNVTFGAGTSAADAASLQS